MLVGSSSHMLDGKNRMRIPAAFKDDMTGALIMCISVNGCIAVYTKEVYNELFDSYKDVHAFDSKTQARYSKIFRYTFTVAEDNQGRILVPEELRKYAGIKKEMVTVGKLNHLEIWAPDRLDGLDEEESYDDIFDGLYEATKPDKNNGI
ncbi:MAG: hypothetical protein IJU84_04655 [Clostridia bacterium]|nr:hypothetical protein [Clostridia bacterium]MBQ9481435.1 hypothetical protein [Clostridia bacterium]